MKKKLLKVCSIMMISVITLIGVQSIIVAGNDTYLCQISYRYIDKNNGIDEKISPSKIEFPKVSETSEFSEQKPGVELVILQPTDIVKIKDQDTKKKVTDMKIYSSDDAAVSNIICSIDGTFKMPAADLEIEIILEDSDE